MTAKRKATRTRTKVVKDDFARAIKLASSAVPTSWLDPLLSGPDRVMSTPLYTCRDIEGLLRAIQDRIRAIAPTKGKHK